ncbi:hypothetical protein SteCoe_26256 [Stentor coeruleus]|uniref:Uncharacterized protein n=1 Tax=Stentor coeruleus TaxID=5963 RepID=A0A1R2BDM9_9CILI|nr:hypothetical protein SteCoe_26256 [Stentor coeruleus]
MKLFTIDLEKNSQDNGKMRVNCLHGYKKKDYAIRSVKIQAKSTNSHNIDSYGKNLTTSSKYSEKNYSQNADSCSSNKNMNCQRKKLPSLQLPDKKSTFNKNKSTDSIISTDKIIEEGEEGRVDIQHKNLKKFEEENNNLRSYLEQNKSLEEKIISLKEKKKSIKSENKLLNSMIDKLKDEILLLNYQLSKPALIFDHTSHINLQIHEIFNLRQDDSVKINKENLQIESLGSLGIINHHNFVAFYQKNNALLAHELKEMKKIYDNEKVKHNELKAHLERELEYFTYKNKKLKKKIDSNVDPNYENLEIEFKELKRTYDLLATYSEEQRKKILEIETGVTEDSEQHIRDLESVINRLQNENEKLKEKLMVALMS